MRSWGTGRWAFALFVSSIALPPLCLAYGWGCSGGPSGGCGAQDAPFGLDRAGKKPYLDLYFQIDDAKRDVIGISAEQLRDTLREGLKDTHRLRVVSKPEHAALQLVFLLQKGPSQWQAELRTKSAQRAPAWLERSPPPLGLAFAPGDWSNDKRQRQIILRLARMLGLDLELRRRKMAAAKKALSGDNPTLQGLALDWLIQHPQKEAALATRCIELIQKNLGANLGADPDPSLDREADYDRAESLMQCVALCGNETHVPAFLDAVSARHERLILHRIETLGALGGEIARNELQMVLDNEKEGPLHEAASEALQR